MSLRLRIILSVILVLSVVMLIFGYAAAGVLNQSVAATVLARLVLARTVAGDLDSTIARSMEVLEKTAQLPSLRNSLDDQAAKYQVLRDTQYRMGTFAIITLLDASGNLILSAPEKPDLLGSNLLYHPGAAEVFRSGLSAIAELHPQSVSDVPMACLATPIWDSSGKLAGILMAELDPTAPGLLVQTAHEGGATMVELLDRDGTVIVATGNDQPPEGDEHRAPLQRLVSQRRAGAVAHKVPDGGSHILAYAPLSNLPEWGLAVEMPESAVLALPGELRWRLIFFGAIALLVAAIIAWLDVRRVVKPVRQLAQAAGRIGKGDLTTIVETQPGQEMGMLACTLEGMRAGLHDMIGKRERYEAELQGRVQQRTEEVAALLVASEAFTSTLDLSALLELILSESRRVCTGAEAGMVVLFHDDAGSLVPAASFGFESNVLSGIRLRPGEGIVGKVFQSGKPLLLNADALADADADLQPENAQSLATASAHLGQASCALCVPLAAKQRTVGSLIVCEFEGVPPLSETELRVLQAMASHAAAAVENAQLYEEVQRQDALRRQLLARAIATQEDERRRIARELHDESAQALTALVMALDAVEAGDGLPAVQRQRLVQARDVTRRALGNVRRLIWDLRPSELDDLGLLSAVRCYAEQRLQSQDVRLHVSSSGVRDRVPSHLDTEMYRILQEAIANIARHARAETAWINLARLEGSLVVVVRDDGLGFHPDKVVSTANSAGLGLLGIRERVALLGGSLCIQSSPGSGTSLTISVPIDSGGGDEKS